MQRRDKPKWIKQNMKENKWQNSNKKLKKKKRKK